MTAEDRRSGAHGLRQELRDIQDLLTRALEELNAAAEGVREHLHRSIVASAILANLEEILGPLPPLPVAVRPGAAPAPPPPIVALLRVPPEEQPSSDIEATRQRMEALRSRLRSLGQRRRAA